MLGKEHVYALGLLASIYGFLALVLRLKRIGQKDERSPETDEAERRFDALFKPLGFSLAERSAFFGGGFAEKSSNLACRYEGMVDGLSAAADCKADWATVGGGLSRVILTLKRPAPGAARVFAIQKAGELDVPLDQLFRLLPPVSLNDARVLAFGKPEQEVRRALLSLGAEPLIELLRAASLSHALATLSMNGDSLVFTPGVVPDPAHTAAIFSFMAKLARALPG